ncbi:MAG TPA: phosphatidylglycerol lysyltransferase domain-containing protein [Gaiellaceae bacterium]|nr:phosphatidylglycerol lysyltransferase domain-containing protein [Gaiellaceae bacterium]
MRLRSPRPESLLAWAAAFVGALGVASALTPEMADRVRLVRGVLPPGFPTAARVGALAFGILLIWLSRSLAARRRRAWQLAVALVIASAIAHLAKGLDVEEAGISLLLLAALLRYRSRFDVPGDPASTRPLVAVGAAAAAAAAVALGVELHGGELPDRLSDVFTALGFIFGTAALYFWLRPFTHKVAQTVGERRVARALIDAYGSDSLSFFALRRDKSYFFSPTRNAFLAYRVVAGAALISGDPVGDETEFDALLAEFRRVVRAHGWRMAVLGASDAQLDRYRAIGLRPILLGEEAVLRPAEFSLEGRPIRKVRQSVTRLTKAGYRLRVVAAEDADPALRAALDEVSEQWRGNQPERGFTMAMDELYAPGTVFAVAEAENGEVGGFLHLAPTAAGGGWSLSTMRRGPDTPNGLTEFLIAETLAWGKETGVAEVSLNFCAFTELISPERAITVPRRFARRALLAADSVFQLERLYAFNRKFFPEWRPRYLCVERLSDLPRVGLAYLHVEQLLVPPGPWGKRTQRDRQVVSH